MSDYEDEDDVSEKILSVYELVQISDFLDDDDVRNTLLTVVKIIAKPDIPLSLVGKLILRLQAYAMEFKMKARHYMFKGKGEPDARDKKNYYMSLAEETDKLVAALKIVAKL